MMTIQPKSETQVYKDLLEVVARLESKENRLRRVITEKSGHVQVKVVDETVSDVTESTPEAVH